MSRLELRYFMLKPVGISLHAEASRAALRTYASVIATDPNNKEFVDDILNWVNSEEAKAGLQRRDAQDLANDILDGSL